LKNAELSPDVVLPLVVLDVLEGPSGKKKNISKHLIFLKKN
jgi:hypothetical protein